MTFLGFSKLDYGSCSPFKDENLDTVTTCLKWSLSGIQNASFDPSRVGQRRLKTFSLLMMSASKFIILTGKGSYQDQTRRMLSSQLSLPHIQDSNSILC